MTVNQAGGEISQIEANTIAELDKLWDYLQTLSV